MNKELANKLKFGTPLHRKISGALKDRLRLSESRMRDRYAQMARNEELFQAYIPEKEVDRVRKHRREQQGVPDYRTIELPYSYSVVMTAHTYFTSVFLARSPVFQLSGRHGESETAVAGMEALLAYQLLVGNNLLPLFVWLMDPGKYGYGVIGHHWDVEKTRVRKKVTKAATFFGAPVPFAKPQIAYEVEDVIGYEGNRIYNVRPQDFFPDPRVALVHFQKGEFCARYTEVPWIEIYTGAKIEQDDCRYINYDHLKKLKRDKDGTEEGGTPGRDEGSGAVTSLPGSQGIELGYDVPVGYVKGHEVYLKLIPRDWGLGDGDRYEIWAFNLTTSGVIFGAEPLGEYHGKFPFDIITDEIDGYSIFPKSTLERCKPLNDIMTWLINAHFYNVRAVLNNQFIVDPSMVVMKDVENPEPGKLIRLKPTAYGKDVRSIISQLQTMDITRSHIGDLQLMMDMVQRMVPANDAMMGLGGQRGGRETATSVRTSTNFAVSRLKTQCEWWSGIGFSPLTQKMVQRTQQHYDSPKKLRLVGDLVQFGQKFAEVDPAAIAGFFDYEPVDGTLPVDRFAQANLWQMIMGQMVKMPPVMAQYDISKIFAWVATLGGIKNIAQFRLSPDQALMQQAQAGNVVPISDAMKDVSGKNMNEPRQIPGAGATG